MDYILYNASTNALWIEKENEKVNKKHLVILWNPNEKLLNHVAMLCFHFFSAKKLFDSFSCESDYVIRKSWYNLKDLLLQSLFNTMKSQIKHTETQKRINWSGNIECDVKEDTERREEKEWETSRGKKRTRLKCIYIYIYVQWRMWILLKVQIWLKFSIYNRMFLRKPIIWFSCFCRLFAETQSLTHSLFAASIDRQNRLDWKLYTHIRWIVNWMAFYASISPPLRVHIDGCLCVSINH